MPQPSGGPHHPSGPHDVGGRDAPAVEKDEHPHALWEYRVDAMMMLLSHPSRRLLSTDELRRNVEALGPGAYAIMGYYERWIAAIAAIMLDRGVVTSDALGRRMEEVEARGRDRGMTPSPDFEIGDRVTVRSAWPPGHVRTPAYIRGHSGMIVASLGAYPNPEELAYRRPGLPAPMLYRVRFNQRDVWPDYRGPMTDTLDIEIYNHWLEPAKVAA